MGVFKSLSIDHAFMSHRGEYPLFLMDKIHLWTNSSYDHYHKLCEFLDTIPYRWSIDLDENRMLDAMTLREEYIDLHGGRGRAFVNGEVSVFEVLVALSIRMEHICYDSEDDKTGERFIEMIHNLAIQFNNLRWNDEVQKTVEERVRVWLDREFDRFGYGSPFPNKRAKEDQRKVELWYQMNKYIVDKYY